MANFISNLRRLNPFQRREQRILLAGNDSCGKTTLLYRLKLNKFVETIPTMGLNVETIEHKRLKYTIFDIAGSRRFRSLVRQFLTPDTYVLYVHDPFDDLVEESLEGLRAVVLTMLDIGSTNLWVVFNKQDLLAAESKDTVMVDHRERFERQLSNHSRNEKGSINYKILDLSGFSAVTGEGCYELLDMMSDQIECGQALKSSNVEVEVSKLWLPSENLLIERIKKDCADEMTHTVFWKTFLAGEQWRWAHRNFLRVNYTLLLQGLESGKGIFECAKQWEDHEQRLKGIKPDEYRYQGHRTATIFWLHHIMLGIFILRHEKKLDKWPSPDHFPLVLQHYPYLMVEELWKNYYTTDLMLSPASKMYWRLPDLHPLPNLTEESEDVRRSIRNTAYRDPYRLKRFAFVVVQKHLSSNSRRGWLIQQVLASLESTTIRLRAKNQNIPPYSATEAYFWIQMTHAALASVIKTASQEKHLSEAISRLTFSDFTALFDLAPDLWKHHYSSKLWGSVEARMMFVPPDMKPLPDVIHAPSGLNALLELGLKEKRRTVMNAELASPEELGLLLAIAEEDIITHPCSSCTIKSHSHLLRFLFDKIVLNIAHEPSMSLPMIQKWKKTAMDMLSSSNVELSLTLRTFWVQQVLDAAQETPASSLSEFGAFIRANMHLIYEELPLCYYSPEILYSNEARESIVLPDLRPIAGLILHQEKPRELQEMVKEKVDWEIL